jgi:hypothetical protein
MRPALVVNEGPLHAGGEARAPAPAQTRSLYQVRDFRWLHLRDNVFECLEAAVLLIDIQLANVRDFVMS